MFLPTFCLSFLLVYGPLSLYGNLEFIDTQIYQYSGFYD